MGLAIIFEPSADDQVGLFMLKITFNLVLTSELLLIHFYPSGNTECLLIRVVWIA